MCSRHRPEEAHSLSKAVCQKANSLAHALPPLSLSLPCPQVPTRSDAPLSNLWLHTWLFLCSEWWWSSVGGTPRRLALSLLHLDGRPAPLSLTFLPLLPPTHSLHCRQLGPKRPSLGPGKIRQLLVVTTIKRKTRLKPHLSSFSSSLPPSWRNPQFHSPPVLLTPFTALCQRSSLSAGAPSGIPSPSISCSFIILISIYQDSAERCPPQ